MKRMNKKLISLFATLTVALSFSLVGCASNQAKQEVDREAGLIKGVRVCFHNYTTKPVKIKNWRADSHDNLESDILPINGTACGEGTAIISHWDLVATVMWRDSTTKELLFGNQIAGYPYVAEDYSEKTAAQVKCGFKMKGPMGTEIGISVPCSAGFGVGETSGYTTELADHLVNVTRLEDSDWKEFDVNIMR